MTSAKLLPRRQSRATQQATLSYDTINEKWDLSLLDDAELLRKAEPKTSLRSSTKQRLSDDSDSSSGDEDAFDPERATRIRTQNATRKMKRWVYATLAVVLGFAFLLYKYHYRPLHDEVKAIEATIATRPAGSLSTHTPPSFAHLNLIAHLPSKHLPGHNDHKRGRLIVVGDVHGMIESLEKLLAKVDFDRHVDHLVLAGDMISKGPDSVGVVKLAMDLGATGIRGNHEDRVLLSYHSLKGKGVDLVPPGTDSSDGVGLDELGNDEHHVSLASMEEFSHSGEYKDRLLARQFSKKQIRWLEECPVILKVGQIKGMGELLVVHGGLVPSLPLERQDPWMVMNMRSIHLGTWVPSDGRGRGSKNVDWFKLWNGWQRRLVKSATDDGELDEDKAKEKGQTVIYGHDSKRGLQITEWTRGIDTRCVKGGKLTAVIIEKGKKGKTKESLVSVKCKDERGKS